MFGISGVGCYALEGMPTTSPLLVAVTEWVQEHAIRAPTGRYLFSGPEVLSRSMRAQYPAGAINLGVAHGQGATIAVAAGAAVFGVSGARELYEDLTAYLWHHARDDDDGPAFGEVVGSTASRMAWCYGDAGLAVVLHAAATAVGDEDTRRHALALGHRSARRESPLVVSEANLCHGAVGLGHIFNRLAQATGDDELGHAAFAWYERALSLPMPEQLDLLEGQLGIALALSAAVTPEPPMWDQVLAILH
jgi:hypothetical protein